MSTLAFRIEAEPSSADLLDDVIDEAAAALIGVQQQDGHWVFPLEADATIPAEYILLRHFLGDGDPAIEARLAAYLRGIQSEEGGWPLFHAGEIDISATVKAYYALKLAGDSPEAPHMRRARKVVLDAGGAARANVFTRTTLALFGQVPWRAVPVMPVELVLLPRWSPFHLSKVSYWSRTVIAPLLILTALKPRARNPRRVGIAELFTTPPELERRWLANPTGSAWGKAFLALDRALRVVEPHLPEMPRRRAIEAAMSFVRERLNGGDGLGAIFPAMANTVMAFDALGYPRDHPDFVTAEQAVDNLLVFGEEQGLCQPCWSPVWDTALAAHALMEAGLDGDRGPVVRSLDWLRDRQVLDRVGDWADRRPGLRPGGWPFQYRNDHYPDVDDTAVAAMALHRADPERYAESIARAEEWVVGMQSRNGGWGAFDADNTHSYLNHIPFADHGALLDPPTVDVTARCIGMLVQLGRDRADPVVARGLTFLYREQEADGSWFGRWGANYVYGTWSALNALQIAGEDMQAAPVRRAVDWLLSRQRPDGGWGEDLATYHTDRADEVKESTASQTAWALLGLMAAGEVDSAAVERGVAYLLATPRTGARWDEHLYTGVGFPRVFYLKYHGYSAYFPLWALSRYRALHRRNDRIIPFGI